MNESGCSFLYKSILTTNKKSVFLIMGFCLCHLTPWISPWWTEWGQLPGGNFCHHFLFILSLLTEPTSCSRPFHRQEQWFSKVRAFAESFNFLRCQVGSATSLDLLVLILLTPAPPHTNIITSGGLPWAFSKSGLFWLVPVSFLFSVFVTLSSLKLSSHFFLFIVCVCWLNKNSIKARSCWLNP
jgi:hypothetical protein